MRFAHIADTHIKNLKYHYEYKEVFKQLYETLRQEEIDCIIHCGDIAHTKTQISPEFVELCSDFFRNLASIAPTYIILGNHDGNLKNSSRQDAITPIVDALGLNNIYLLKNAGEHKISDDFCLNVLSVFDRDNWQNPSNKNTINIALYHGAIQGCQVGSGFRLDHGEDDLHSRLIYKVEKQPDIWIQITIPNEFQRVGKFNKKVTASWIVAPLLDLKEYKSIP
mgnify:CR=1 FL=1